MKKTLYRIMILIICLLMVLGMGLRAFAEEKPASVHADRVGALAGKYTGGIVNDEKDTETDTETIHS